VTPTWHVFFSDADDPEAEPFAHFYDVPVPKPFDVVYWQAPPGYSEEGMHRGLVMSVSWFFQLGVDRQDYRAHVMVTREKR